VAQAGGGALLLLRCRHGEIHCGFSALRFSALRADHWHDPCIAVRNDESSAGLDQQRR
jgi:hypothetical protein